MQRPPQTTEHPPLWQGRSDHALWAAAGGSCLEGWRPPQQAAEIRRNAKIFFQVHALSLRSSQKGLEPRKIYMLYRDSATPRAEPSGKFSASCPEEAPQQSANLPLDLQTLRQTSWSSPGPQGLRRQSEESGIESTQEQDDARCSLCICSDLQDLH